jgi:hypothetical protein
MTYKRRHHKPRVGETPALRRSEAAEDFGVWGASATEGQDLGCSGIGNAAAD